MGDTLLGYVYVRGRRTSTYCLLSSICEDKRKYIDNGLTIMMFKMVDS